MKSFLALHWCGGAMVVIPENSLLTGRDMLYVANVGVGRPIGFTYSSLVYITLHKPKASAADGSPL
jgi:hypothetical protein